jgi:hypothetical protein
MQLLSLEFPGFSLLFFGHVQNPFGSNITAIAWATTFGVKQTA